MLFVLVLSGFAGAVLIFHPEAGLPDGWDPRVPLRVADPVTPLTDWKLRRALADPESCKAALAPVADLGPISPVASANPVCGIATPVYLARVGAADLGVQTDCATALTFAMWERHGVQPAARTLLGSEVAAIRQIGSYNCRRMRTASGASSRWSSHATAGAIDVTGFSLTDGRDVTLLRDWDGTSPEAAFLRAVRDKACDWFGMTLGPDFNRLHADHFHLQVAGWGTCR